MSDIRSQVVERDVDRWREIAAQADRAGRGILVAAALRAGTSHVTAVEIALRAACRALDAERVRSNRLAAAAERFYVSVHEDETIKGGRELMDALAAENRMPGGAEWPGLGG